MATSGADYGYDGAGRLSNYEGALPGLNSTFPAYMPKYSNYTFNANGNVTARPGQTLVWDVQNRLYQVTGGTTETYLYDPDGQRVKKTVGSTVSLYPFAHYEITGSTVTKYYFFAGMRVAMKQGSTLTYLHSDHLGSTVLETNTAGNQTADQKYRAYGKQRDTGAVVTDHKFTGQKLDATGLQYYQSRYYDPAMGVFISPDTVIPDPTNVFDYNRYMFVRGNPLKYNDPTGHDPCDNGSKNCDPLWLEYNKGETSCSTGRCGIPYERFLDAKQQYAAYKSNPDQYAADQQILNGDIAGDVEAAKTRISNGMLYASYFAHKNPDIDITLQASTEVLLASMSFISGNTKDVYRGKWLITREGTERTMNHDRFGNFFKSKSDGLWWSKDQAGHGGSNWKVYEETGSGLRWIADADEYGDFIQGKHKSNVGEFVPWKELRGVNQ